MFLTVSGQIFTGVWSITFALYGSNSPPSAFNSGTLLGTANPDCRFWLVSLVASGGLGTAPINIVSSDKVTTYAYVWVAMEANLNVISATGGSLHSGINY